MFWLRYNARWYSIITGNGCQTPITNSAVLLLLLLLLQHCTQA
jgi:hypothetical protein